MREQVIDDLIDEYMPPKSYADQWDTDGLHEAIKDKLTIDAPVQDWAAEEGVDDEQVRERLIKAADEMMAQKAAAFGPENMRNIEKQVLLQTIDSKWREHLLTLEHLRSVVGFRGYAQRDPLNEYKNESFQLFESMLDSAARNRHTAIVARTPADRRRAERDAGADGRAAGSGARGRGPSRRNRPKPRPRLRLRAMRFRGLTRSDPSTWGNPSRNDPCPCGSGKKFKHCHGRLT